MYLSAHPQYRQSAYFQMALLLSPHYKGVTFLIHHESVLVLNAFPVGLKRRCQTEFPQMPHLILLHHFV